MTITQRLYAIGCMLFLWYACLVVPPQLALLAQIPLGMWELCICIPAFLIASWVFHRNYFGINKGWNIWLNVLLTWFLFGLCLWASAQVYDTSFDGNWYHMDAVYLLGEGWTPAYHVLGEPETSFCEKYLNHFPIGSWVYGAFVFVCTKQIEMGKAFTLHLMMSSLLVAQHLGRSVFKLSVLSSWLLALLVAGNPIQILNLFSFYTDGAVSCLIFLGIAFALYQYQEGGWVKGFLALLAFALLANLKFNAAAIAFVFVSAFLVFLFFTRAYKWQKLLAIGFGWGILSFGVLGWSPYMSNLIRDGHPLYPLNKGSKEVFDVAKNYPANFIGMNRFEKFIRSFYAQPEWCRGDCSARFKPLFSHVESEIYKAGNPDLAGMGPFAPEVFMLVLPLGLLAFFKLKGKLKWSILGLMGVFLFSIFINPEAWVMRYVPQFWLFMLFLLVLMLREVQLLGPAYVVAIALILNSTYLADYYTRSCRQSTANIEAEAKLVREHIDEFAFYGGWTRAWRERLYGLGLKHSEEIYIKDTDSTAKNFSASLGAFYRKRNIGK